MERHRCKLCWRRFGSGRALGGHMRSHVMNPSMYNIKRDVPESDTDSGNLEDEMEVEEDQVQECSMIESSVSESESSKKVLTGRRSKRCRPGTIMFHGFECSVKKGDFQSEEGKGSELRNHRLEQESSLSDSTVEDVAFCLIMLSRDKWNIPQNENEEEEVMRSVEHHEEVDTEDDDDDSTKPSKKQNINSDESNKVVAKDKYKCETCSKTFNSYQALGGHKASHNKVKTTSNPNLLIQTKNSTRPLEERIHQCPICFRVFSTGQALGGHKRSHSNAVPDRAPLRFRDIVIDLNFPAPADDDNIEAV